MTDNFQIYYPLSKIEEQSDGTLMVWARATQEIPDSQKEIFDYASSLPIFKQRAQENLLDTDGAVAMSMKTMHQPITTPGKWMEFVYNDAEKAIDICGKVVDPVDVKKVKEKVFRGVSVGGHYARRWRDPEHPELTRFTGDPMEISLVDRPAVPTAKINMFKVDAPALVEDVEKFNENHDPENGQFAEGGGGETSRVPKGIAQSGKDRIVYGNKTNTADVINSSLDSAREAEQNGKLNLDSARQKLIALGNGNPTDAQIKDYAIQAHVLNNIGQQTQNGFIENQIGRWNFQDAQSVHDSYNNYLDRRISGQHQRYSQRYGKLEENNDSTDKPAWVDEFNKSVQLLAEIRKEEKQDKNTQEAKLKAIGEHAEIARREGSPLRAPKDYPDDPDEYGDPANFNFPVDEKRHVQAVGRFNSGTGSEQYTPGERHNVGRRVARLASRFGTQYAYDPKEGQITPKKEVKKMEKLTPDQIKKLDAPGLIAQLKAIRDQAADQVGKDPGGAVDFLMSNLSDLTNNGGDSASVGNATTLPAAMADTGEAVSVKAAAPADSSTSSTPTPTPTPTPAKAKDEKKAEAATTPTPAPADSSASSTPTPTPAKKAEVPSVDEIQKQINDGIKKGFDELLAGLKKSAAPIASGDTPVLGMQAIVNNGVMEKYADMTETERKIVEIMDEGGAFAMQKAMKLVMGDDDSFYGSQTAQQTINAALAKATRADFNRGGVIMAKNFVPKIYTEPESTK
jgi:hypothetical protein